MSTTHPVRSGLHRPSRLAALEDAALLDTPAEPAFDRLTRVAATALGTPVALLSLVDHDRQFFKSCVGLPEPWASERETPLSHSFCQYVVLGGEPLVVEDAREHDLLHDNLAIRDLGVIAYAGVPLVTSAGEVLGSLCAIDGRPRRWRPEEVEILVGLAAAVMTEVELRAVVAEQRRTRVALQQSEERFRSLVEQSQDWIWEIDADGRFTYVSPSAEQLLGYPAEQILGRTTLDFMDPAEATPFGQALATHLAARTPFRGLEKTLRHADGGPVVLETSGSPVLDESGALRAFRGIARDVTLRKRSERLLRLSEERFRLLVDGMSDYAIIMLSPEGAVASWNRGAETITGYAAAEVIGRPIGFLHPGEAPGASGLELTAVQERHEHVTTRVRRDGTSFPAHVVVTALRGPDGQLLGFAKVLQDLSEKIAREEKLRTLSLVASKTDNAVIITDDRGRIDWVNEGYTRITGYTLAESIGRKPGDLLQGPDTDPVTVARVQQRMRDGESFVEEILNYHRDGRSYWISMAVTPIRDDSGRVVRYIAIETDITERKAADAELARAKEEAEQANTAKSEFLARMSHELRTPLNAVLGFGQLLLADVKSEDDRESAEHILKAGRHLLSLINEVLDIARIEAGEFSLSLEPVSCRDAVDQSVALIRAMAEERGITLRIDEGRFCDGWALADLQRLKQILLNLLSNAIKYNRPGGTVAVVCQRTRGDRVRILVEDTGVGIAPASVDRLFTPFDRLGAEHGGIEGTGLGLALSQKLAEAMGGTIGVRSRVGAGSTFWVELAAGAMQQLHPAPEPDVAAAGPAEQEAMPERTVLYIEDSLPNFRLVERIFGRMRGVHLISAMQGRLGLELAQRHRPDLILLDINLPDIPGTEVLARLREHPELHDTPVVVISANAMNDQVRAVETRGVHAYLTKPFDVSAFVELTERLLDRVGEMP